MEKSKHKALNKVQKVLKSTLFLFSLICFLASVSPAASASVSVFEQQYTINLSFKNASVEQVLDAIMKQSGIKIAYSSEELKANKAVSVNLKTSDIREALRTVLGDGYTFKQIDDYIAIARNSKSTGAPVVIGDISDDNWCTSCHRRHLR